ncbi:hypothetical protein B0H10DRAFT_2201757 [Mycena sp. CBHHK59/15]|nr:hypothetical protein B0H10DRAFT_2201757 [Mycena sp. CBHHK59/15]
MRAHEPLALPVLRADPPRSRERAAQRRGEGGCGMQAQSRWRVRDGAAVHARAVDRVFRLRVRVRIRRGAAVRVDRRRVGGSGERGRARVCGGGVARGRGRVEGGVGGCVGLERRSRVERRRGAWNGDAGRTLTRGAGAAAGARAPGDGAGVGRNGLQRGAEGGGVSMWRRRGDGARTLDEYEGGGRPRREERTARVGMQREDGEVCVDGEDGGRGSDGHWRNVKTQRRTSEIHILEQRDVQHAGPRHAKPIPVSGCSASPIRDVAITLPTLPIVGAVDHGHMFHSEARPPGRRTCQAAPADLHQNRNVSLCRSGCWRPYTTRYDAPRVEAPASARLWEYMRQRNTFVDQESANPVTGCKFAMSWLNVAVLCLFLIPL